jgi:uncharacterized protein
MTTNLNVNLPVALLCVLCLGLNLGCKSTSSSTTPSATKCTPQEAAMFRDALARAQKGDALAQCQVGQYCAAGQGCEKNPAAAVLWYRKAAEQGNAAAQTRLGICYDEGNGIDYSATEALRWLRKAAAQGDAEAQAYLAAALSRGPDLCANLPEAMRCVNQAAKQGNPDAQGGLLWLAWWNALQAGKPNGSEWQALRASAEKGNRKAEVCLGFAYLNGCGMAENEAESLRWFLLAAAQQEPLAESFVASAYFHGLGTNRNIPQAIKWARQAAEHGEERAQTMLAHCYQTGTGVKRNYAAAIQWFRKAAARGSEEARTSLGLAYRDGKIVERDYPQAYHWLDLAALQGNTNAIAARDDLFRRLTPAQRAGAGAVARPRLAKYDSAFTQSAESCTMSSYALAANHFTGLPVTAFFEGYCHHFGIAYTNALDAEVKYSHHFDTEFRRRNCLGIEVMLDLHTNATERCFVEARKHFDAHLFRESVPHLKELEQALRDHDAALSMGVDLSIDVHTVTVFADGPQLFVRDPERRGFHAISALQDIGKLVDSVLYVAK